MSGGSMEYLCFRVEEIAGHTHDREIDMLVKDFANLLHDLEWYDSGDYGEETYRESIRVFKAKWLGAASRTDRLAKIINTACDDLKKELIEMIGGENDETN